MRDSQLSNLLGSVILREISFAGKNLKMVFIYGSKRKLTVSQRNKLLTNDPRFIEKDLHSIVKLYPPVKIVCPPARFN